MTLKLKIIFQFKNWNRTLLINFERISQKMQNYKFDAKTVLKLISCASWISLKNISQHPLLEERVTFKDIFAQRPLKKKFLRIAQAIKRYTLFYDRLYKSISFSAFQCKKIDNIIWHLDFSSPLSTSHNEFS